MTVFVVGSLNADTRHRVPRIPAPGETVSASATSTSTGGKGANQAVASSAAGAPTIFIAACGDDAAGERALTELRSRDVDVDRVTVVTDTPTGSAQVFVDDSGENAIVITPGANAHLSPGTVEAAMHDITSGDVVVLQNEVPSAANHRAAQIGRSRGASIVWNAAPSPRDRTDLVDGIDILIVNEHELCDVARLLEIDEQAGSLESAVARAISATVICTRGAEGGVLADGVEITRVASLPVDPVDTTAAGDATVGYLAALLSLPLVEALSVATAAGAITVTRPGASCSIPPLHDVLDARRAHTERNLS